jgi:hypothetical protein
VSGQEEIAGKEQRGLAIAVGDMGGVVARSGNHVDDSVAEIDLSETIGPIGKAEVLADMSEIGADNLNVGKLCELRVAEAVIEMASTSIPA